MCSGYRMQQLLIQVQFDVLHAELHRSVGHILHIQWQVSLKCHVILRNAHEEDSELTSLLTTNTAHNTQKVFKQRSVL